MRNIFDQYQKAENQLTHALATPLALNPRLCRGFVEWLTGRKLGSTTRLIVEQQTIPGSQLTNESELENRSLPDICIHNGADWCLAIESKVGAPLTAEQLQKHRHTLEQRNFSHVEVAAVTAGPAHSRLPPDAIHRTWEEVYVWIGKQQASEPFWCDQLREFMRTIEARQLRDSTMPAAITTLDTIRFGSDYPYSNREGKLLLRQAISILRKRPAIQALGIDPEGSERQKITGKGIEPVWAYITLKPPEAIGSFTRWPHFTLGMSPDKVDAMVTIPNAVSPQYRRRLRKLGADSFAEVCAHVASEVDNRLGREKGAIPMLSLVQRHFRGRHHPVTDGRMHFDLHVIGPSTHEKVVQQPLWAATAYDLLNSKNGNVQFQVGVWFPHDAGVLRTDPVEKLEAAWLSCKPLLNVLASA